MELRNLGTVTFVMALAPAIAALLMFFAQPAAAYHGSYGGRGQDVRSYSGYGGGGSAGWQYDYGRPSGSYYDRDRAYLSNCRLIWVPDQLFISARTGALVYAPGGWTYLCW